MPRLIFLNRYFFPDHSATSQVLSKLAFALASAGEDVHVITSQLRYDDPQRRLSAEETVDAVKIHRVWTSRFGRSRLIGRSIDYLSFYISAWRALNALCAAKDLVVAKTDPPLLSLAVWSTVRRRGARLINWLQDLYPEIAIVSGMSWLKGPLGALLIRLRNGSLRAADANVVVGERMAERLLAQGIPRAKIRFVANFAPEEDLSPVAHEANPLRRQWSLTEKFVVGYSGNLGRVHEFSTILNAAARLKDDPRILFLCIGGGTLFDRLQRAVAEGGLQQKFVFQPYQPRELLKYSLSAADVHWISLRPEFEGLVVPSKVYSIAAAGRPIISICDERGEISQLVRQYRCGFVVSRKARRAGRSSCAWPRDGNAGARNAR